jgi:hypothetical protein
MEEISIKVNDFNVYDLFKSGSETGSSDTGVILVQNLEKKVLKKFEFIDEKIKRADEENYKLKTEILNFKKFNENTIKIIEDNHREFSLSNKDIVKNNEKISILHSSIKVEIEELKKELEEKISNGISEIKENKEKKIIDENLLEKTENIKSSGLSNEELKMIKENSKKITEIDKSLKLFISNCHLDSMKNNITKLQEDIITKANSLQLENLKDQMSNKNYFY